MKPEAIRGNGAEQAGSSLSKEFTGWKLNVLDAIVRDPEVKPVDFPIVYVIMQHVNRSTRMAAITDKRLQRIIHRDRKALMKGRKRLISLGWIKVRTGRYGRATEYWFLDDRATRLENIRLDEQLLAQEDGATNEVKTPRYGHTVNEAKTPHRARRHSEAKTPRYDNMRSGKKMPHTDNEAETTHSRLQWGENGSCSGEVLHPLHINTPKRDSLPVQNRALETYEAHVLALDCWVGFEETAARLEYDEQLQRDEAERRGRVLCGYGDGDTDGRWSAGTAPPTAAKPFSEEGTSDDQDHPYHD